MIFPTGDNVERLRSPWMLWLLLAVTAAAFATHALLEDEAFLRFITDWGMIPANMTFPDKVRQEVSFWPSVFTSIFLHGGFDHLFGNMYFLWIFGDNVQQRMGPFSFLAFYLLCGIGAALTHVAMGPNSTVPTIGASGAISGVLGAYVVMFPHASIRCFAYWSFFWNIIKIPAVMFIVGWFAIQLISAVADMELVAWFRSHPSEWLMEEEPIKSGGVAFWAHVGGFAFGALLALIWPRDTTVPIRYLRHEHDEHQWQMGPAWTEGWADEQPAEAVKLRTTRYR